MLQNSSDWPSVDEVLQWEPERVLQFINDRCPCWQQESSTWNWMLFVAGLDANWNLARTTSIPVAVKWAMAAIDVYEYLATAHASQSGLSSDYLENRGNFLRSWLIRTLGPNSSDKYRQPDWFAKRIALRFHITEHQLKMETDCVESLQIADEYDQLVLKDHLRILCPLVHSGLVEVSPLIRSLCFLLVKPDCNESPETALPNDTGI